MLLKYFTGFITGLMLCWGAVTAQPANNQCANAIPISNPSNFCSETAAFSLVGATYTAPELPSCQFNQSPDLWFTFEAIGTDLSVRVNGDAGIIRAGTILFPEVTVYEGTCNGLGQIGCLSNAFGNGVVEVLVNELIPSNQYFIRVSSRNSENSTFQLCINNFFSVPNPSADCNTGVILCDKSTFTVPNLIGVGNDPSEADGTCVGGEFASAWYKWTCEQPGSLYFTLTPNNPSDDLDFALFELPNGIGTCSTKELIRCMASGENLSEPLENWIRCYGPTGLRPGATGDVENPGCAVGDDNFLAPIEMVAGRSYALLVNNFSNTGSGFTIDFGGTGTFQGPEADFTILEPDRYCRRDSLLIVDQSRAENGSIIDRYAWNFGPGSLPATAETRGPLSVYYESPGFKNITLSVANERGCIVSKTRRILVECCDYPVLVDAGNEGIVDLGEQIQLGAVVDLPGLTYQYMWSPPDFLDCADCENPFALVPNDTRFLLVVTDEQGCVGIDSIMIRVNKNKPVYVPNAFSPNGDNINDRFTAFGNAAATNIRLLRIYNRWGGLVYEGVNLPPGDNSFGWDGTFRGQNVEPGVFVYYIEMEFLDEDVARLTGEVNLFK